MSVWTTVKILVRIPYRDVSIRRLVKEVFNEAGRVEGCSMGNSDVFQFAFCGEGIDAAKDIEKFCSVLREHKIRAELTTEIRFLT